jgi:hypothetical protein
MLNTLLFCSTISTTITMARPRTTPGEDLFEVPKTPLVGLRGRSAVNYLLEISTMMILDKTL